jgi:hypothetical protein
MVATPFQQIEKRKTFWGAPFDVSFVEIRIVWGAAGRSHLSWLLRLSEAVAFPRMLVTF